MIEIHNGALVHAYVIEGTPYYARIHLGPFFTSEAMFNFDKGLSVKIVYNCP